MRLQKKTRDNEIQFKSKRKLVLPSPILEKRRKKGRMAVTSPRRLRPTVMNDSDARDATDASDARDAKKARPSFPTDKTQSASFVLLLPTRIRGRDCLPNGQTDREQPRTWRHLLTAISSPFLCPLENREDFPLHQISRKGIRRMQASRVGFMQISCWQLAESPLVISSKKCEKQLPNVSVYSFKYSIKHLEYFWGKKGN